MPKKKAIGRQGWWFASVDGIALPCLHKEWLTGLHYHDPFKRHEGKGLERKIQEAVDAITHGGQVILTSDKKILDPNGELIAFERTGYIAAYEVGDVTYSASDGLRLRLTKRLYDLE